VCALRALRRKSLRTESIRVLSPTSPFARGTKEAYQSRPMCGATTSFVRGSSAPRHDRMRTRRHPRPADATTPDARQPTRVSTIPPTQRRPPRPGPPAQERIPRLPPVRGPPSSSRARRRGSPLHPHHRRHPTLNSKTQTDPSGWRDGRRSRILGPLPASSASLLQPIGHPPVLTTSLPP